MADQGRASRIIEEEFKKLDPKVLEGIKIFPRYAPGQVDPVLQKLAETVAKMK
jgi:hypothetical protein